MVAGSDVVGGVLPAPFVSKDDVERWPVIRTIARLGRTVFVNRISEDLAGTLVDRGFDVHQLDLGEFVKASLPVPAPGGAQ